MTTHFNDMTVKSTAVAARPELYVRTDAIVVDPGYHKNDGVYARFGKRAFDLVAVLIAAPLVLPFVLLMALIVMKDGGNPFYKQQRIGRNGRIFTMWKLRTMVDGAHDLLQDYLDKNPEAKREWEETQKLRVDPRITRFGHALRKSSMDELPQLWNVLMGHMSLVGPRPMMVEQESIYPGKAYFKMLPGITGNWQVSERNESTFVERARYDNSYLKNISFRNDLAILFATVKVVLKATGR